MQGRPADHRWIRTVFVVPWLLGVALGLTGCGSLANALNLRKPSARIVAVRLENINLRSATLQFDVELENPYSVPLPLVNMDYGLASQERSFLSGDEKLQGSVPARGRKTVSLPATVDYLGLLGVLQDVRPGAVIPYEATLGLSVDAPVLGLLRLPLKKEGSLPVPTVPDVAITEIQWDQITLDRTGGHIKLQLVNRNQFPVEMSKLACTLSLGGVQVAGTSVARSVAFDATDGAGAIEIPISFSPKKLGLAAFRMLSGGGAGYRLQGELKVQTPYGSMLLPIEKVGNTVFRR